MGGILSTDLDFRHNSSSLASLTEVKGLVLSYIITVNLSIL